MSPQTKDRRRKEWQENNFGGTVDWALDLQIFSEADLDFTHERPLSGEGCNKGDDITVDSGDLCQFTCGYGFCPPSLCYCKSEGPLKPLPQEFAATNVIAYDAGDVDLNRLCRFACKYNYCPEDVCMLRDDGNEDEKSGSDEHLDISIEQNKPCEVYKDKDNQRASLEQCKGFCKEILDKAREEQRTSSWGCVPRELVPNGQSIPWEYDGVNNRYYVEGRCFCDSLIVNELADGLMEGLAAIAQVSSMECAI